MTASWDYTPWGEVHSYPSVGAFERAGSFPDGVHKVGLDDGNAIELLISGSPFDVRDGKAIPVFMSGALTGRSNTAGPYFSGRRMAGQFGIGFLAFSDPLFATDPEVELAWYTGRPGSGAQEAMARMARHLMVVSATPLLFVGGSGGGFASLALASAVAGSKALVWNPQTSLLDYSPPAVRRYLNSIYGGAWDEADWQQIARERLDRDGIVHDLSTGPGPERMIYLQNHSDWHLKKHLVPFLKGAGLPFRGRGYYGNRRQGVIVGRFGDGHVVPDAELLRACIESFRAPGMEAWDVLSALVDDGLMKPEHWSGLPADLRNEASDVLEALRPTVVRDAIGYTMEVRASHGRLSQHLAFRYSLGSENPRRSPLTTVPRWTWEAIDGAGSFICTVEDGFGNTLGNLEVAARDVAVSDAVLVYGSCVSRDAFELPGAPELYAYYARSSVASSMSSLPSGLEGSDVSSNPSKFQRAMVEADLNRRLPDVLAAGGYRYLLVDLIDERFELATFGEGLFSVSPELVRTGISLEGAKTVSSGSIRHFDAFRLGWRRLVAVVPATSIVVNRVFWAEFDREGRRVGEAEATQRANRVLEELYTIIQEESPDVRWIEYPVGSFVADPDHKWGLSPFHYSNALYETMLERLAAYLNEGAPMPEDGPGRAGGVTTRDVDDLGGPKGGSASSAPSTNSHDLYRSHNRAESSKSGPVEQILANVVVLSSDGPGMYSDEIPPDRAHADFPLSNGEVLRVDLEGGVEWSVDGGDRLANRQLWHFSLEPVARLSSGSLSPQAMEWARRIVESFVQFSADPGAFREMATISSADHSASMRVRALVSYLQALRRVGGDPDEGHLRLVIDCLVAWSRWLADDENFVQSNHGVMSALSLLHAAVQLKGHSGSDGLAQVAFERVRILSTAMFDSDGMCNENTLGYHQFNLRLYRLVDEFAKANAIHSDVLGRLSGLIARGEEALSYGVWQDGSIPPIGDSPIYRTSLLSVNRPRLFAESGFAVIKNDDLYVSLICGARSENHKQQDDTSVTVRYRNRDILVDAGSYVYDRFDPYRRYMESSRGHSGVFPIAYDSLLRRDIVARNGGRNDRIADWRESFDGVSVRCVAATADNAVVAERKLLVLWSGEIVLVDTVSMDESIEPLGAVQRFLFGPKQAIRQRSAGVFDFSDGTVSGSLFQLASGASQVYRGVEGGEPRGWVSFTFGKREEATGIDFVYATSVSRFAAILRIGGASKLEDCSRAALEFAAGLGDL